MLVLAFLSACAASAADWVYRVRPNDNIWDLSSRYLKPDVSWQRLQSYNGIADPHHLPPGMILRVPIEWLRVQPADAHVVAVAGNAQVELLGQASREPVAAGMMLGYGAKLSTGNNASLTLQFADGSRVLMQSDSELVLDHMSAYGATGMVDTRMRLQHGHVSATVTPMTGVGAHFSVETPGAVSSVRGTHFRVAADAGQSQTEVLTGGVDVAGDDAHVLVPKQYGVALADGSKPGPPQPLLDAPVVQCPAQPINRWPYAVTWAPIKDATSYRMQMASNDKFEALLLDRLDASPAMDLPDVPDGDYTVRVRGIDRQKLEGMDGTCVLRIARTAPFTGENLYYRLPSGHQLGTTQAQGHLRAQVYIPNGESMERWTEMLSVQILHGMNVADKKQFWATTKEKWSRLCAGSDTSIPVDGTENGYAYAFWMMECPRNPSTGKPEVALFKIIQGNDSFYVLQKTFRFKPTKEQVDFWIGSLKSAVVCDRRQKEQQCPDMKTRLDEVRL